MPLSFVLVSQQYRRVAGCVVEIPGVHEREIFMEQVAEAGVEPSPDRLGGYAVSPLAHAVRHAGHREIGAGEPEEEELEAVAGLLHALQCFHVSPARQGRLEAEVAACLRKLLDPGQKQPPGPDRLSLWREGRQA